MLRTLLELIFNVNYEATYLDIVNSINTFKSLVDKISSAIVPIGISLIVLFWMVEFLNKTIRFQESNFSWEHITMHTIKLVIAKYIVQSSTKILDLLSTIADETTKLISLGATTIPGMNVDDILNHIDGQKVLVKTQLTFTLLIFALLLFIVQALIKVILYGRAFELVMLSVFGPIPLSTIMFDGVKDSGKGYLKNYFAVCFQGAVIMVILILFGKVFSDAVFPNLNTFSESNFMFAFLELIVLNTVLVFSLFKSGEWSKKIIGG